MDEAKSINEVAHHQDEENDGTGYNGLDELSFPFSELTEEEDQAYYNDNRFGIHQRSHQ